MNQLPVAETSGKIKFKVRVQPRASRNEITGWHGDALKIRLTAPPVEGEANQACLRFLADFFQVNRRQVNLVSGLKSRTKTIEITDFTLAEFKQFLGG
ncbi:MAG TPA: YggU family protein [Clostridia bacterium]|nr:YggU family protein [Clostridia bacterium]